MVLELLLLLLLVKQLAELPSGLPVPFEGRNLRALEKMGLVRAENFQLSSGPHHRSPQWRRCSGRSGSGWGRAHNLWSVPFRQKSQIDHRLDEARAQLCLDDQGDGQLIDQQC